MNTNLLSPDATLAPRDAAPAPTEHIDRLTVQTTKAREPGRKDLLQKTQKTVRGVGKKRGEVEAWMALHRGYA